MSVRVHDLAKHCGLTNKEMIEKLRSMNYPVKSASSTVDKITAEAIEKEYGYTPPAPAAPPATPPVAPTPAPVTVPPAAPAAAPPSAPASATASVAVPASAPSPAPTAAVNVSPPATPTAAPAVAMPVSATAPPASAKTAVAAPPSARKVYQPPPPSFGTPEPSPYARPLPTPVVPAPAVSKPASRTAGPVPSAPKPPPKPPVAPTRVGPSPPPGGAQFTVDAEGNKTVTMKPPIVVRDLAQKLGIKPHILLSELLSINVFANLAETISEDAARKICERRGFKFELEKRERGQHVIHQPKPAEPPPPGVKTEDLQPRPPVVTVMGHVDHGKTSLLDAIRQTDVAAHETGGITQHIGAGVVQLPGGKQITFLDTPGHEAFTKMRARGAMVTDIAVLVVAADDGVMPQTVEAINHARAAKVPIVVAVNKCDLPAANPDRVKKQLQEHGLTPDAWGGDTLTVDVSAKTRKNLDELLEAVLLQAEMMELKASPKATPHGNVIEAQIEPGMGPTATVLVRQGTLKVGDAILVGPYWGKVRALIDDKGKRIKQAGPSVPAKIVGLTGCPDAGAEFTVMKNEREAREVAEQRQLEARQRVATEPKRARLEDLMSGAGEGEKKNLALVLKADVQGSLEAITDSLGKLKSEKVELDLIHAAVGNLTENDVLLASASNAVLLGFRVKPESGVTDMAKREGVSIKLYSIIYELLEQVEEALKGLLEPEAKELILGHAEVRKIFTLSKGPPVAGCYVTDGRITRGSRVRLLRRRAVQYEGRIGSLRHFQDDVKEVKAGSECGLRLENFQDYQPGDIIECYTVEKIAATL